MVIYNSLSQQKELFETREPQKVSLYVCGITPYDTTHLGHAFLYIFFDIVWRYLTYKGYDVAYVQNVTDIDDDILKRAKKEGRDWKELGDYWTTRFLNDLKALNVQMPTKYVKATEAIDEVITMVNILVEKGFAYESEGNVYFDTSKDSEYGKLSKLSKEEMEIILNERGGNTNDPLKKHPLDFNLWQKSKNDEPFWESPWGNGRPGWHIECSAMVKKYLGDQIDMHGGGKDLLYPHHESEIAQSENATGEKPFVQFWMHAAMLSFEGEKMSKSLGNLVMATDLLKTYAPDVIRWVLLSHHYRQSWEFHMEELAKAEEILKHIKTTILSYDVKGGMSEENPYKQAFEQAMNDDFNIPEVLRLLQQWTKDLETKEGNDAVLLQDTIADILRVIGFSK